MKKTQPQKQITRYLFLAALAVIFVGIYQLGIVDYLNFDFLKSHLSSLHTFTENNPLKSYALFFWLYILTTALSIPGATILTLLGGALFGVWMGVLLVSIASTIGATLAFFASRFLFKDFVSKKFANQVETINQNIEKEGAFYLLTLRLIPVFPFFIVNLLMGLTAIKSTVFFLVSYIGMLPAITIYVFAGLKFSELTSLRGILSPPILLALVLLGLFPYGSSLFIAWLKRKKLYRNYKRPNSFDYNMIVIGGGSGGLVTAYIASAVKSKVALIEKNKMGGDCLNYGCVPSKALIKTAKVIHQSKKAHLFGIKKMDVEFDFQEVMKRVKRVIDTVEPHDSKERYRELGVDCFSSFAKIISPFEVLVDGKILTTQFITVATGAKPLLPAIVGLENANYITSDTLWDLKSLPQNLLIVGAGPIGCEMAQCFSRLGSTVTMIDGGPRILSKDEAVASALIHSKLLEEGIRIALNHRALEFGIEGDKRFLRCEADTGPVHFFYDTVLIAVGRKANVTGFGLEELKIAIRKNGTIETNAYMQTSLPNIMACGDVTGPYQLTHAAAHQAWYCAVNSLFGKWIKFKVNYRVMPWCTFTDPEVASVGLNEETAILDNIEYEVTKYELGDLDRAIADDDTVGFVKVITKKGTDKILGVTIVGSEASIMILEFVSAMKNNKGLKSILGTVHIYPSRGEANKYAAGLWSKNHAPKKVLKFLAQYFTRSRK